MLLYWMNSMTNKRPELYSLHEFQFAKQVNEELPKILVILDNFQSKLYPYMHYHDVAQINYAINDAKAMFDVYLESYREVLEKKGKIE